MPSHEWSLPNKPLTIDPHRFSERAIASVAAISYEKGIEHVMHFHKSVNQEKFIEFLIELRKKVRCKRSAIFMDNLKVHHCKKVKE